ncbi:putative transmembrane protein [Streptomyces bingchenggensis BCW-1]|uniref:Putative transmembrane protein n=1 Tax=Streptomyces bingchenggensis (strain BCW-1) TaxID=749414 RepID=D7CF51_STRBB|nr:MULTISPECIES: glycosyl hydrolase family 28 protein [Streptomyces]ADI13067.1 putative transmembrane protein [Streptomyces bingchenggensis BCW-1]
MNWSPSRRTALTAAGAAAASATGLVGTARAATPAAKSDTTGDSVVIHPTLASVPLNTAFTVKVRPAGGTWQKLDAYLVKLAQIDPLTGRNQAQSSSMAAFDFSGTVEVEVTYNPGGVEKVRIRPDSYGITPEVLGSTARFTLDRPRNLVIQVNDKIFDCLHLLANPVEQNPPKQGDPKVIYFGPGLHTHPDRTLKVPSGTTVHLAAGAVLTSNVVFEGVENCRLTGHGVIDNATGGAILVHDAENVHVDGITVLNPRYGTITVAESQNVAISNLRSFSQQGWGDGIDIFCADNVTIDGCFLRNSDDCIALYTHRWDWYGDTRNITVKNSTLWADVAHPINIGTHGNPDPNAPEVLENLRFENIDILDHREPQMLYQGCIAINPGDGNLVRNVKVDNIRVEDIRWGQLIHMRVTFNPKWNEAAGRGIENVHIKDLTYTGTHAGTSLLIGLDADHVIKDITFENLVINGRVIRDSGGKPNWYLASDGVPMFANDHAHNLRFLTTEEAAAQ